MNGFCRAALLFNLTLTLPVAIEVQAVPILNPANNHYYELFLRPGGVSWDVAADAASNHEHNGVQGFLATITSESENEFLRSTFQQNIIQKWLGGHQNSSSDPSAGWSWITGEPWSFTKWAPNEPNDFNGAAENALHFKWTDTGAPLGTWNDLSGTSTEFNGRIMNGYFVEYANQVLLDFTQPAPFFIQPYSVKSNGETKAHFKFVNLCCVATTPFTDQEQQTIASAVESIYAGAGIRIDVVTKVEELVSPPQATVYFANESPSAAGQRLNGIAERVDRFNTRKGGERALVYRNNRQVSEIAVTAAHEIGHLFGLIHSKSDLSNIMHETGVSGRTGFSTTPLASPEINGITHNPAYHLQRYLADQDSSLTPGSWDLPNFERLLKITLPNILNNLQLYDVVLAGGIGGVDPEDGSDAVLELGTLSSISETSTFGLSDLELRIFPGEQFTLFASSAPGGPVDVYLELADGSNLLSLDNAGETLLVRQLLQDGSIILASGQLELIRIGGDFNDDGHVDAADYTVWRNNFGTNHNLAGNGDEAAGSAGVVDFADYSLWKENFGLGAGTGSDAEFQAAVPEPSALLSVIMGFAFCGLRRRRRQSLVQNQNEYRTSRHKA